MNCDKIFIFNQEKMKCASTSGIPVPASGKSVETGSPVYNVHQRVNKAQKGGLKTEMLPEDVTQKATTESLEACA